MMQVLLGTTNPSKAERFKKLLSGCDVEFLTLRDLNITKEPAEQGSTPEENARIKAAFYGQYFDAVICNDSGLYFDGLPLDDPRQPGLNIRTPEGKKRLDDEEMIDHYSRLINSLGGKTEAFYLDGMAVCHRGQVFSFMDRGAAKASAFWMVDTPSPLRHPGWPLDSLSIRKDTGTYFVEKAPEKKTETNENTLLGEYRRRLSHFLKTALGLPGGLKLVKASPVYQMQITDMLDEWKATGEKIVPYALRARDWHDFDLWLSSLDAGEKGPLGVPDSTFFCLDETEGIMVGAVNIRHRLNEKLLLNGGHMGDGIRPSRRNRGYGTQMIALALMECRKIGLEKVLMVCDKENIPSARTIQKNGGVLENEVTVDGITEQRYWIDL